MRTASRLAFGPSQDDGSLVDSFVEGAFSPGPPGGEDVGGYGGEYSAGECNAGECNEYNAGECDERDAGERELLATGVAGSRASRSHRSSGSSDDPYADLLGPPSMESDMYCSCDGDVSALTSPTWDDGSTVAGRSSKSISSSFFLSFASGLNSASKKKLSLPEARSKVKQMKDVVSKREVELELAMEEAKAAERKVREMMAQFDEEGSVASVETKSRMSQSSLKAEAARAKVKELIKKYVDGASVSGASANDARDASGSLRLADGASRDEDGRVDDPSERPPRNDGPVVESKSQLFKSSLKLSKSRSTSSKSGEPPRDGGPASFVAGDDAVESKSRLSKSSLKLSRSRSTSSKSSRKLSNSDSKLSKSSGHTNNSSERPAQVVDGPTPFFGEGDAGEIESQPSKSSPKLSKSRSTSSKSSWKLSKSRSELSKFSIQSVTSCEGSLCSVRTESPLAEAQRGSGSSSTVCTGHLSTNSRADPGSASVRGGIAPSPSAEGSYLDSVVQSVVQSFSNKESNKDLDSRGNVGKASIGDPPAIDARPSASSRRSASVQEGVEPGISAEASFLDSVVQSFSIKDLRKDPSSVGNVSKSSSLASRGDPLAIHARPSASSRRSASVQGSIAPGLSAESLFLDSLVRSVSNKESREGSSVDRASKTGCLASVGDPPAVTSQPSGASSRRSASQPSASIGPRNRGTNPGSAGEVGGGDTADRGDPAVVDARPSASGRRVASVRDPLLNRLRNDRRQPPTVDARPSASGRRSDSVRESAVAPGPSAESVASYLDSVSREDCGSVGGAGVADLEDPLAPASRPWVASGFSAESISNMGSHEDYSSVGRASRTRNIASRGDSTATKSQLSASSSYSSSRQDDAKGLPRESFASFLHHKVQTAFQNVLDEASSYSTGYTDDFFSQSQATPSQYDSEIVNDDESSFYSSQFAPSPSANAGTKGKHQHKNSVQEATQKRVPEARKEPASKSRQSEKHTKGKMVGAGKVEEKVVNRKDSKKVIRAIIKEAKLEAKVRTRSAGNKEAGAIDHKSSKGKAKRAGDADKTNSTKEVKESKLSQKPSGSGSNQRAVRFSGMVAPSASESIVTEANSKRLGFFSLSADETSYNGVSLRSGSTQEVSGPIDLDEEVNKILSLADKIKDTAKGSKASKEKDGCRAGNRPTPKKSKSAKLEASTPDDEVEKILSMIGVAKKGADSLIEKTEDSKAVMKASKSPKNSPKSSTENSPKNSPQNSRQNSPKNSLKKNRNPMQKLRTRFGRKRY
ncbi:hypothetical protein ACHAWF_018008 [Thalassiosira exigua]